MEQKQYLVINSKASKEKILWKFNLYDLIYLGISVGLFGLSLLITFTILHLGIVSVISSFSLLLILSLGLIGTGDKDKRVYNYILSSLTFIFKKKIQNRTSIAMEVKEEEDFAYVENANNCYSAYLRVKGSNLLSCSVEQQINAFNLLSNILRTAKTGKILSYSKRQTFEKEREIYVPLIEHTDKARRKFNALTLKCLDNLEDSSISCNEYILIIYDYSKKALLDKLDYILSISDNLTMLNRQEIIDLYKLHYHSLDNDKTLNIPSIIEKKNSINLNGNDYVYLTIKELPRLVSGGYLSPLFQLKNVEVIVNYQIDENIEGVIKRTNKRIKILEGEYDEIKNEARRIVVGEQIDNLRVLVNDLVSGTSNESLFNIDITLKVPNNTNNVKNILNLLRTNMGCKVVKNQGYQSEIFYSTNLFSPTISNYKIDMVSTTLGALYPFITTSFYESEGDILGYASNGDLFSIDLFKHLPEKETPNDRTNGNMSIIGKSGAGKSYFSKILIANELSKNRNVIIFDVENEYSYLSKVFDGNIIDLKDNSKNAVRFNPFEFFNLDDGSSNPYLLQLNFLTNFFGITLPNLSNECRDLLEKYISLTYRSKKINEETDINSLKSKDFPIIDDLINLIEKDYKNGEKNKIRDIELDTLNQLLISLEKFRKGNLYGTFFNNYSNFDISNKFTIFNFQNLDGILRNALMILATNFVNSIIIKNSKKYEETILMIDEAHNYINPKFPVALELMKEMAKRIRKYRGILIVATQQINDFLGYDDNTKTLASAVLNNCNYQVIFSLSNNDLSNVIDMLNKSNNNLTESEIDYVKSALRGQALFFISNTKRTQIEVSLLDNQLSIFFEKGKIDSDIEEQILSLLHSDETLLVDEVDEDNIETNEDVVEENNTDITSNTTNTN